MTEAEWLACDDPAPMLQFLNQGIIALVDDLPSEAERQAMRTFLQGGTLARKLALFSCGCCHQIWQAVPDPRSRAAVEIAEQVADGRADADQAQAAALASHAARNEVEVVRGRDRAEAHIRRVAANACWECGSLVLSARGFGTGVAAVAQEVADVATWVGLSATIADAGAKQAGLLRDIFGNPFRPIAFDPCWRTADVLGLARGIYEDLAFDLLPLLADALMDAGCDSDDLLAHCRSEGPHVRGCWAVDLALGKEPPQET